MCDDCRAQHARPIPRCTRCALPLASGQRLCGACQTEPPPYERVVCVADYGFPWDRLIADFKFHGRVELAAALAAPLGDALGDAAAWPDRIVPVPLAPRRLRERGYNQAWELARRIARRFGRRADAGVLQRPIDGAPQAGLDRRERLRAMRGAFVVAPGAAVGGERIAVIDDVLTTGATAAAAANALLGAGAAAVQVWVIARTP